MAREINKLTPSKVANLNEPGRYADGGGLYLQVSQVATNITKAWLFRYMFHGRARSMGLGSVQDFTLAEARSRARDARRQVADGIDPIGLKKTQHQAALAAAAKAITFKAYAEQYIKDHEKSWKNEKHRKQWKSTLATYAYPIIGSLSVADVEQAHIQKIIEPLWHDKPETADRLRSRIELILDGAKARGYRHGDNPARWKGHLDKLLPPKRKVKATKHHEALPVADIPAFMSALRERDNVSARALEFTILNASRTNETIGARWSEFDLNKKIWTIPAERMKAKKEHVVPLSDRSVEILTGLPQFDHGFVFSSARTNKAISNMAMLELMRGIKGNGFTVHGFRSTFRDWAGDMTNHDRQTIEHALAHRIKDKSEASYRRSTALEKRRQLMRDWSEYCAGKTDGVVVSINAGAAQ